MVSGYTTSNPARTRSNSTNLIVVLDEDRGYGIAGDRKRQLEYKCGEYKCISRVTVFQKFPDTIPLYRRSFATPFPHSSLSHPYCAENFHASSSSRDHAGSRLFKEGGEGGGGGRREKKGKSNRSDLVYILCIRGTGLKRNSFIRFVVRDLGY